ncbi:MAG TPA: hypothetical protein PK122_01625 [Candidatus Paceibacterota bacterium]|jgi:hypothetical protein|nr:hypothetical protein [Candidatus Paceibacterota bacterium]
MIDFNDRLKSGKKAWPWIKINCSKQNVPVLQIIRNEWYLDPQWSNIKKDLQRLDKYLGDQILDNRFFIDSKMNYISWESIQEFKGDFFAIFDDSFSKRDIFFPETLKRISPSKLIFLPSKMKGFSLDQIHAIRDYSWDDLLKLIKNKNI